MIANNYTFQVTINKVATTVTPINNDFTIEWQRQDEEVFFRKVIETEFVFCKDDFTLLYTHERSCDRCQQVRFEIFCTKDGEKIFDGYLNMNEGAWNPCKCEVSIAPIANDEYACIDRTGNMDKNIIEETNTKYTVRQFIGEIECQICTEGRNGFFLADLKTDGAQCNPTISQAEGWRVTSNLLRVTASQFGVTSSVTTRWCREFYAGTTMPPGDDWVAVTGGFARPLEVEFLGDERTQITPTVFEVEYFFSVAGYVFESEDEDGTIMPATTYEYDNGMRLEDVLNVWLLRCGLPIKSNFFGINPDGNYPNNVAYDFALANYQNLLVYQNTDIINADASENATKAETNLTELLEMLKALSTRWAIIDGQFCLEHISFFEQTNGNLDIANEPTIAKLEAYTYLSAQIPQLEKFAWSNEASDYFEGSDIVYNGFCLNYGESEEYNFDIYTDLSYAIANLADDTRGLFLLSTIEFNGELFVNNNNKSLSWTEIHDHLWLWNRYQAEGEVNGINRAFESVKRLKKQEPLTIRFCCDQLKDFDTTRLIRSQLGWGELDTASFVAKDNCLTIELLHDIICQP